MTKHKSSHTPQVIYFSYIYKKKVEGNCLPREGMEDNCLPREGHKNVRASYKNSQLRFKTSQ